MKLLNRKQIEFGIQIARQKLEFAISEKNEVMEQEANRALLHLYQEQNELLRLERELVHKASGTFNKIIDIKTYKRVKEATKKDLCLLYSDAYLNGLLCTQEAYNAILKQMDECDRQSHVMVSVAPEMVSMLEKTINEIVTLEDFLAVSKSVAK